MGGGEDGERPEVLVGELGAREEGEGVARVKKFHVRRRENGVSAGTEEGGEGDKGVSKSGGGSTPKRERLEAGGEEDPAGAGGFEDGLVRDDEVTGGEGGARDDEVGEGRQDRVLEEEVGCP